MENVKIQHDYRGTLHACSQATRNGKVPTRLIFPINNNSTNTHSSTFQIPGRVLSPVELPTLQSSIIRTYTHRHENAEPV